MEMVGRYRRTVSFPDPSPNSRPSKPPSKSYHVRSASLPCGRSHPLIPHLRHQIQNLRSWHHSRHPPAAITTTAWLLDGLHRLNTLLHSLDDILQMPLTQDSLSQSAILVESLLEAFLLFVDVFGIFQISMLSLKQELSAAQIALRRKDDSNLSLSVRSQKEIAKEMSKLVSTVRSIDCTKPTQQQSDLQIDDHEIPSVIRDVHELTGSVSMAVFEGVLRLLGPTRRRSMSSSSWLPFSKKQQQQLAVEEGGVSWEGSSDGENYSSSLWGMMRKMNGGGEDKEEKRRGMLKKMEEVEECVNGMEKGSEMVFRSLISTRVSLLNILTHA